MLILSTLGGGVETNETTWKWRNSQNRLRTKSEKYIFSENSKKSYFEIVYATVISVDSEIKNKKDLEKIILCDVQVIIYPNIEKAFRRIFRKTFRSKNDAANRRTKANGALESVRHRGRTSKA